MQFLSGVWDRLHTVLMNGRQTKYHKFGATEHINNSHLTLIMGSRIELGAVYDCVNRTWENQAAYTIGNCADMSAEHAVQSIKADPYFKSFDPMLLIVFPIDGDSYRGLGNPIPAAWAEQGNGVAATIVMRDKITGTLTWPFRAVGTYKYSDVRDVVHSGINDFLFLVTHNASFRHALMPVYSR